jgi:hypothetical protein
VTVAVSGVFSSVENQTLFSRVELMYSRVDVADINCEKHACMIIKPVAIAAVGNFGKLSRTFGKCKSRRTTKCHSGRGSNAQQGRVGRTTKATRECGSLAPARRALCRAVFKVSVQ